MKAREIMTLNPQGVLRGDTIATAAGFMRSLDCGALPVIRSPETLEVIGILTDRDITIRCAAQGHDASQCLVEDHMTPEPLTLRAQATVGDVASLMSRAQIRRVPITRDSNGALVGIVALADLASRAARPDLCEQVLERVSEAAPVKTPV